MLSFEPSNASASVLLTPVDAGSGIYATYYTLNGSGVTTYTAPIAVSTEGTNTLKYYSVDMAGNVEEYVADDYAAYPGGPFVADHLVQIHGAYRVARGGSFARWRDLARTRRRQNITYSM